MNAGGAAAIAALERRIGYEFSDRQLLMTALTHASAASAAGGGPNDSYQRLEFLGDRVLGLAVADMLLKTFPRAAEGELHRRHASLVRKETCAAVARSVDLGAAIRLGGGEIRSGGQTKDTILGDVCEALIGALYLDAGYQEAQAFIDRNWRSLMLSKKPVAQPNAKAALQEWVQAKGMPPPTYRIIGRGGPDHAPNFIVEVKAGLWEPGRGEGRSRRDAEQEAAADVLRREKIWNEESDVV